MCVVKICFAKTLSCVCVNICACVCEKERERPNNVTGERYARLQNVISAFLGCSLFKGGDVFLSETKQFLGCVGSLYINT